MANESAIAPRVAFYFFVPSVISRRRPFEAGGAGIVISRLLFVFVFTLAVDAHHIVCDIHGHVFPLALD